MLPCPLVPLAQPSGVGAGVEKDVVPATDLPDDGEGPLAPIGELLNGSLSVRLGQEQLTQMPNVVEEQGSTMPLGRIRSSRRIAYQHHGIAGYATGPDIVIRKESDGSLLLDGVECTFRHVLRGDGDESVKRAINLGFAQSLGAPDQVETRHLGTGGKPVDGYSGEPREVIRCKESQTAS